MPKRRSTIPFPQNLWDLLQPQGRAIKGQAQARHEALADKAAVARTLAPRIRTGPGLDGRPLRRLERRMLKQYGVRVRKWRTSMSGVAWQVTYQDGSVSRLLESPKPKGPMSCAIFLHEIGHHAIGFKTYKPRCLEEYHAWKFAIDTMEAEGLNVTDRVHERMRDSLRYAVAKAVRRGLKKIPVELMPYLDN